MQNKHRALACLRGGQSMSFFDHIFYLLPMSSINVCESFPFFNLPSPLLIRFFEICSAKSYYHLSQVIPPSRLPVKRLVVSKVIIFDYKNSYSNFKFPYLKNFDKNIEVFDSLTIDLSSSTITESDVDGIIRSYSTLIFKAGEVKLRLFRHMIGPCLEKAVIQITINDLEVKAKLIQEIQEFVDLLKPVKKVE